MTNLDKQVILITGGARGLGEAIGRELGLAGAYVILADIRLDLANKIAEEINNQGGHISTLLLDLTSESQIEAAVDQIKQKFGRLDVLINSAGIDKTISIEEMTVEDWDCVIAVNLRAPFILSKYALSMMKEQGSGYIINICSTAAKRAWPNASVYHASKWGLLGYSHALLTEARPHHVKVTALLPGGMRTPFLLERFPDIDINALQDPKNVAETVHFLLNMPEETVIPEMLVLPMQETSWP